MIIWFLTLAKVSLSEKQSLLKYTVLEIKCLKDILHSGYKHELWRRKDLDTNPGSVMCDTGLTTVPQVSSSTQWG